MIFPGELRFLFTSGAARLLRMVLFATPALASPAAAVSDSKEAGIGLGLQGGVFPHSSGIVIGSLCAIIFILLLNQWRRSRESKQLRVQTHLLQTILDALPTPIFYKNERGIYLGCNTAFEEFIGKPRQEVVGQTVYGVSPPEKAAKYDRADLELLTQRGIQIYEAAVQYADGSTREVMFHKATFANSDGSPGGLVGAMLDITERRQREQELAALSRVAAALHERVQRSNGEMIEAYDRTIEGWSRILDLRDEETEGHARRVTELAMRLARRIGVQGDGLIHLRRGALLHDIGKMGIPDRILRKPGTLTPEETKVMQSHPTLAYQFLSPIGYLRPALEIPYCHHEKWDGSGYPLGLKGEQIPLAARIFAIVDVWDALTSHRPYRAAWPEEKVCRWIRKESGKHFDPRVVEFFFDLLDEDGARGPMPSSYNKTPCQPEPECSILPSRSSSAAS